MHVTRDATSSQHSFDTTKHHHRLPAHKLTAPSDDWKDELSHHRCRDHCLILYKASVSFLRQPFFEWRLPRPVYHTIPITFICGHQSAFVALYLLIINGKVELLFEQMSGIYLPLSHYSDFFSHNGFHSTTINTDEGYFLSMHSARL